MKDCEVCKQIIALLEQRDMRSTELVRHIFGWEAESKKAHERIYNHCRKLISQKRIFLVDGFSGYVNLYSLKQKEWYEQDM